jgi:hypothetical protein
MSSAERVIAWNEVLTSAGLDPHAVPDDVKRIIHAAVMRYAKASGWREPTAAPQRVASGERSAVAGDGPLVRFGRDKGKRLSEVADLAWYRRAIAESVEDPSRERYRAQNEAHLVEVDAEIARRS